MEFLVASNNQHKLTEIRRILAEQGHVAKSLAEIGLAIDPEETGATFEENAMIKAKEVCKVANMPTIADDSGLEIDALQGAPGVYSARFAGNHDDFANNQKVLELMKDMPQNERTARFVSVVALVLPNGAALQTKGTCEGTIGFVPAGENGFGYDPLFYVGRQSFAQLSPEQKDAMSHRGAALRNFSEQLPAFLQENLL